MSQRVIDSQLHKVEPLPSNYRSDANESYSIANGVNKINLNLTMKDDDGIALNSLDSSESSEYNYIA